MKTIDLVDCVPANLAEEATYDDLWQTVRGIEIWQERQAEVLDFIYRFRLIALIRSRDDAEESVKKLKMLGSHLDRVTHPERCKALNALSRHYGERWIAYQNLVEQRIAVLEAATPETLLNRAHVKEILRLVLDGPRSQKDIEGELGLKPPNAVRILKMMEANELIERQTVGRENRIIPGPVGERLRESLVEPRMGPVRRGASYLVGAVRP